MKTVGTIVDDSVERLAAHLDRCRRRPGIAIDNYFYRSHLVYERELESLVYRSWIYAGHSSEIAEAGEYLLLEIGEDSLIITRGDDGEIRALMNICRHRGARVCEEASGTRKTFVCPYHGWVYNNDGSLRAARDMEMLASFKPDEHGLKQARVQVYMGLIFINCDPEAADFLPMLENLREPLGGQGFDRAKVAHKRTYRIDANWKLALENYLECYHCATSHRAYARMHTLKDLEHKVQPLVDAMLARCEEVTGVPGMAKQHQAVFGDAEAFGCCAQVTRYGLFDGYLTGSEDGQPVAPLMGDIQGYDGGAGDYQLGPLTYMLNYPDHGVLYRFIPRGLTATDMEVVWFVREDATEGVDYDLDRLTWLWHHTTLEDEYIIKRNAEGVNSRFFVPGPYHPEYEELLQSFIHWYLDTLTDTLN